MTKGGNSSGPACGCFGSSRGRQPSPSRPKSASDKDKKFQAGSAEQDEGWKIGTLIPQTLQPQTPTPALSPPRPVESCHGETHITKHNLQQGPATWYPSGLSVKSGSHDVSTPATSPHKPASSVATALHDSTAMQRQPPAAAAGEGSSVVHGQQQLASGHSHDSSYATAQPAQPPAGCTAAAAGDQPSAPQQMQHGIPGFAAMPPAQQSAAMLAKWGMAPAPDVQMQQLMQQSQGPQHQQQQESEAGQAQLKELPSPSGTDQQGGPTRSAPAANPSDQDAASHSFTAPDDAMGRPAPEGRLYPTQAAAGSQSARMQDHNSHLGTDMTRRHAIGSGDTTYTSRVGASQTAQQSQEGLQGGTVLVREHNDGNEEGLALEQPDGEGSNPPVTPEVVRGRVVRATELWHRQRLQQEALQQAQQTSDDLAHLRGQNQNEQLAVPLLWLAAAVQAALAWQQKVGDYSVESLAHSQQLVSVRSQPSGVARHVPGQPKKSTAGEVRRAVQQMEAQLRATRQDALQLATAVVRLEKEKAVLQTQVSGQGSVGDPSRQPQHGCGEGNSPEDRASAPPELGHLAEQCTGAGVQAKGAATPADAQSSSQSTKRIAALAHQHEKDGAEVDVQSPDQPAVAAVQPAVAVAATAEGGQASPRFKADTGRKRKPWGSSMTLRGGSRGGSQSVEGSSSSRGRSVGSLSPQQRGQPAKRGLSQPSLRLGLGSVFSAGGVLDSSSGQQASSSRSEGGSPRHGAEGRLPSFMDSTRSSQAHMQGQLCPTVADSVETDVRRQPFRPSGVHVVLGSNSHAAEGLSGQTQHAQHGVAELSPHCAASAVSSTFPNSTQSSRARHHGELRRWPLQHDCEKDGELTSQLDGVSMHDGQWRHDDQVCRVPTAGPGGEMPSKHAQSSDPDDAAQMLPQSAGCELRKHPEVTASVSEKEPGFDDAKPPSFMLPTASSLAHTAAGHRASLGKSASMTQI